MRSMRLLCIVLAVMIVLAACGSEGGNTTGTTSNANSPIIIAWLPNESGAELNDACDAIGKAVRA